MMIKRKIWKSIGAIILLLMFHVNAMATDYGPFPGVDITINDDGIAEVSLSASGAISSNMNWPSNLILLPWDRVSSFQFKSVNGAEYNSDDWGQSNELLAKPLVPRIKRWRILYVEPTTEVLEAYSNAEYWHKFFIKGVVKIYLRPTDLQRPQVSGVQQLEVTSPNVNDGYSTTFTINTVYVRSMVPDKHLGDFSQEELPVLFVMVPDSEGDGDNADNYTDICDAVVLMGDKYDPQSGGAIECLEEIQPIAEELKEILLTDSTQGCPVIKDIRPRSLRTVAVTNLYNNFAGWMISFKFESSR